MSWELQQYVPLVQKVMFKGEKRKTRAGNAYSIFGECLTIDMSVHGFPLLRGRKMFYKPVIGEMAAMLKGPKSVEDFKKYGCNYWDSWGKDGQGELNLDYGNSWLNFNGVNQLEQLVKTIKTSPTDRRMLISGWRPENLDYLSLPCCHLLYQWYVRNGKYLDMIWYQRSVDTMIGLPSDIILAATWNILLANECGYEPGELKFMLGDTHIYENHVASMIDYLKAVNPAVQEFGKEPIRYTLDKKASVFNFEPSMLEIENYEHAPAIKFELNI